MAFILRKRKRRTCWRISFLVGGKCEIEGVASDILERTLKREIFEEVGIEVTGLRYVNSSSFVTESGQNVIDIVFLCEHESGEPYAKSKEEGDDVMWLTTQEIFHRTDLPPYLKKNIEIAQNLLRENR